MNDVPLRGKKILITRARGQSGEFAVGLRAQGAEVIEFPTIEILPPANWKEVDQAIDRLKTYDWIVFTSANGVNFFFERLAHKGHEHPLPPSLEVCAIGPATAARLKDNGIRVNYMPKEFVAEAILRGFRRRRMKGRRILLARAREARDVLPKGLEEMGARVDVIGVYRTVKPRSGAGRLRRFLKEGRIDAITFTSSSTVNHFVELLKKDDLKGLLSGVAIACIGPITARTAKGWGMDVRVVPEEYTIPGLTQAMIQYLSRKPLHCSLLPGKPKT